MKRYLLKIILFFSLVLAIDLAVGGIGDYLQAHAKSGESGRVNYFTMKQDYDIIIFGSSRAHHHYDTPFMRDSLGLDVYNAGFDGNGIVLAYGLLELILERYRPNLIIFDVEPTFDINVYEKDNNHVRYLSFLKPYYRHTAIGNIIKDVSLEEWYKVHSGMIRYNSNLITMIMDYKVNRGNNNDFIPLYGVYEGDPIVEGNKQNDIDFFKLSYLEKMILLSKNNNVPIVFVASPKYSKERSCFQPVKDICKKHNIQFWDFYSEEAFMSHKEWFKEPMHLNNIGARQFSKIVSDSIINQMDE